jgi:hypothetical protein
MAVMLSPIRRFTIHLHEGGSTMLRNYKHHLAAAAAAVTAATIAITGVAASASVAHPGRAQAPAAAARAPLPTITITMNGKKITVSGALQSGGVRIVSKVSHEPQASPTLVRLDPGVTVAQFLAALPKIAADQNNIDGIGSIVFSPQAGKGTSSAQANLAAGQYIALDVATSGQPPLTTFVITKAASPAALPRPRATIASIEFGFRGATRLHDGELVRFANHGFLTHMIIAVRARSAAGARAIARLLKAGKDGKAQRLATSFYAFVGALSHGAFQQQVIHNRPGFWVLACFMDTQDHREHTTLGMERVIHIVR